MVFAFRLSGYDWRPFIFAMYAANNCNFVCLSSVAHTLQVIGSPRFRFAVALAVIT
nr:MAG TPA: hypothetical protein [Caudoviricetes sp.]